MLRLLLSKKMLKIFAKKFFKKKARPDGDLIWINGVLARQKRNYNCRTIKKNNPKSKFY